MGLLALRSHPSAVKPHEPTSQGNSSSKSMSMKSMRTKYQSTFLLEMPSKLDDQIELFWELCGSPSLQEKKLIYRTKFVQLMQVMFSSLDIPQTRKQMELHVQYTCDELSTEKDEFLEYRAFRKSLKKFSKKYSPTVGPLQTILQVLYYKITNFSVKFSDESSIHIAREEESEEGLLEKILASIPTKCVAELPSSIEYLDEIGNVLCQKYATISDLAAADEGTLARALSQITPPDGSSLLHCHGKMLDKLVLRLESVVEFRYKDWRGSCLSQFQFTPPELVEQLQKMYIIKHQISTTKKHELDEVREELKKFQLPDAYTAPAQLAINDYHRLYHIFFEQSGKTIVEAAAQEVAAIQAQLTELKQQEKGPHQTIQDHYFHVYEQQIQQVAAKMILESKEWMEYAESDLNQYLPFILEGEFHMKSAPAVFFEHSSKRSSRRSSSVVEALFNK